MRKVKKGDLVVVIAGNEKGNKGKVARVYKNRVWVEEVNKVKKHVRKNLLGENTPGTIVEIEAPIQISNVAVICPSCGERSKLGLSTKDGKKSRVCKKCNALIDLEKAESKKESKKADKSEEKKEDKKTSKKK